MLRDDTSARLQRLLEQEQVAGRLPTLAAGLVRDGALVWSGGAGDTGLVGDPGDVTGTPRDGSLADVQYRIGSITKTFVAVLVLRLRDEGRLDLSDPVDVHVPGTALGGARIGELLSHTAGLRSESHGPWWERTPGAPFAELATGTLGPDGVRARPGRRFHYSNPGFAVLGEIVARRRGRPWDDVLAREVLAPLGLRRTTTRPQPPHARGLAVHPHADAVHAEPEHDADAMAPAGQLWSTVADQARWAAFLAGDGGGVLSADTLAEMREPVALEHLPGQEWTSAYGLGLQVWNRAGRLFSGHGGSMPGFLAVVRVDGESGDGVVVLTNSTAGLDRSLAADLLDTLAEHEPVQQAPWRPGGVAPEVLDVVGTWFWGPAPFTLRSLDATTLDLTPAEPGSRASRFRRTGPDRWRGLDGYYAEEDLQVVRRADGAVSHLDLGTFVLTRSPYDPDAGVPGGVDARGWGTDGGRTA